MAKCIECKNFNGKRCIKAGFIAKCPSIHLPCRGFEHTNKNDCLDEYDDFCKHRVISDTPFSADWCGLKKDYCNNNKLKV